MGPTVLLLVAVVALCLAWYLANQFYKVAEEKGFTDRKYLWICFWLGVIGYLLVIALPDRGNRNNSITPAISDELPDL